MDERINALMIGGPADGQFYSMRPGQTAVAVTDRDGMRHPWEYGSDIPIDATFGISRYNYSSLVTDGATFHFLIFEGTSMKPFMSHAVDSYAEAAKKRRRRERY